VLLAFQCFTCTVHI